ncbi:UDP-N-acetylglucosamine--N-acetylmuramyl-(pentapeptide) pyrophosphoryl-undecaprenol N-acetylglucosamine transferase [Candidatus Parcubacteria bacterium]|nr:MAG: UDP-N-acetylglucosamine--N-acetylmuramyl-(pentapeptide) pyrophosphoryl-undecaprenol N-acetylglucosamine transferase [Candidatus Parcubacteria bacterium]
MDKKKFLIVFTGGGTAGSVTPLLALASELKKRSDKYHFFWIGARGGIEKSIIEKKDMPFKAIFCGNLRRYFSWRNFLDPFLVIVGFLQALVFLMRKRPLCVIAAGSFTQVPVGWAAWSLRIPLVIHQQDIRPGLANRLTAPAARVITTAFEETAHYFGKKAVWIGNFIQAELEEEFHHLTRAQACQYFGFNSSKPVVLIMGGSTGAQAINSFVYQNLTDLIAKYQIIHLTGYGKGPEQDIKKGRYVWFEFLSTVQIARALRAADVVFSRAGLGALTEFSYLGKPVILIPIPNSHQEDNASYYAKRQAALVLPQKDLNKDNFIKLANKIIQDKKLAAQLKVNIRNILKDDAFHAMKNIVTGFMWDR